MIGLFFPSVVILVSVCETDCERRCRSPCVVLLCLPPSQTLRTTEIGLRSQTDLFSLRSLSTVVMPNHFFEFYLQCLCDARS